MRKMARSAYALLLPLVAIACAPAARQAAASPAPGVIHVAPPAGSHEADRASILAALERVRPGGTVQFAAGTYRLGGRIVISVPGVTLLGSAAGTTLRGCDSADLVAYDEPALRSGSCAGIELTGARQTVRNLTFEHITWASLTIMGGRDGNALLPATTGGHLIEGNTFRDSDSFNVVSDASEPIVIRDNTFINTYHAVAIQGRNVHFLDNIISAPEPGRIPYGRADIAIGIAKFAPTGPRCEDNLVVGNRIDGHPEGIAIGVFAPGSSCRGNIVRGNTIAVGRATVPAWERQAVEGWAPWARTDSIAVGVAVRLLNYPRACGAAPPGQERGPMCPKGGSGQEALLSDNLIEGNRLLGGEGIAIEILYGSGNRIADNTIVGLRSWERFPAAVLRHAPGWARANGSGIWVSPGSDENEIVGNVFEGLTSHAIVIEGDRNVVETGGAGELVRDLGNDNRIAGPDRFDGAAQAGSRMVDLDGHAVHVYTAGWEHIERGLPVVVFEAGAIQAWGRLPARLADEAAVVAYDRAGIGRSEWDEQAPAPEHVVRRLHRLLDVLGAPPPYLLVGQSIGGPLVLSFARRYPDAIAGLVLVDPTPPMAEWLASFDDIGVGRAGHEEFLEMAGRLSAMLPPGARAEMEHLTSNMGDFAGLDASRPGLPVPVPVAVLLAGAGYEIPPELPTTFDIDRQHAALLRRQVALYTAWTRTLPDATITVANNSRHCIQCWDPDLVLAAIRRVLFPDIRVQLRDVIETGRVSTVGERFQLMKSRYPAERFHEDLLDRLGYELLSEGNVAASIVVFELNVREYPGAPKPHDSLGDAYRAAGRLEAARTSYEQAVRLAEAAGDPRLPQFRGKLERMDRPRDSAGEVVSPRERTSHDP